MFQKIGFIPIAVVGVLALGCAPMGPRSYSLHPVRAAVGLSHAAPNAPDLKRLPNGHYRVRQPWTVTLDGRQWHVQKGYQSNGITGPNFIKRTMGDGIDHPETWAAVFHDWLFTQPGMTRELADRTFHELLIAYGVSPQKAELMYSSVRAYSLTKGVR
ncbi:MAG: DUF1353 domain-containing protein [Luteolibacter sp.]